MYTLMPTITLLLFPGPASKVQPGLVEETGKLICSGCPDHHGRRIGHIPETFFALAQKSVLRLCSASAQFLFQALALGDVADRPDHPLFAAFKPVMQRCVDQSRTEPPAR